jgi:hypothetical protein
MFSIAAARPRITRYTALCVGAVALGAAALTPPAADHPSIAPASSATAGSYTIWSGRAHAHVSTPSSRRGVVGTRFTVGQAGTVTQLRYFKARGGHGKHVGTLWTAAGRQLASVTFSHESRKGWQTVSLATPVALDPGETYVVAYETRHDRVSTRRNAFGRGRVIANGPVTAVGGAVGRRGPFPAKVTRSAYLVDVVFSTTAGLTAVAAAGAASPALSGAGFPDASNTGARGTLSRREGGTITTNGTVIQNALITSQLTVRADNVVLRNVTIQSDDLYGLLSYGTNTVIEDATIIGTAGDTLAGIAAYDGSLTARRVDVSGSEDGVRLTDNSVLADSYVHGLAGTSSSHYDGVTADGYRGWTISHNTIINDYGQTAAVWIGDPRYAPSEGVLANNYLAGGGYAVYAGPGTGAGLRVTGNVFSTLIHARGGYWGPITSWSNAGNTWSGNTWSGGSLAGAAVTP